MTDTARVPHHLHILGEVWAEFAHRLDAHVVPSMPIMTDRVDDAQGERLSLLATREIGAMQAWIERLALWMHGPLAAALMNADIPDREMRRVAERFSHFTDELIEQRAGLTLIVADPAMRAAAPRIDAVYVVLLRQVRDFVSLVAEALGPAALTHPNGRRDGNTIELSFTFTPNIDAEMAQFCAWMDGVRTHWSATALASRRRACGGSTDAGRFADRSGCVEKPAASTAWSGNQWVGMLLATCLFASIVLWDFKVIVAILLMAALVWCLRHPAAVILALLVFVGCSPN